MWRSLRAAALLGARSASLVAVRRSNSCRSAGTCTRAHRMLPPFLPRARTIRHWSVRRASYTTAAAPEAASHANAGYSDVSPRDTIYSCAGGDSNRSPIVVYRVSGPAAQSALSVLTRAATPPVRKAAVRTIYDPTNGEPIDKAIVLFFQAPNSFTGEDMVEVHGHGGRAAVSAMMAAFESIPVLRMAERGEYSRRAVLNEKMDLTEAEGLCDLICAETSEQRRVALSVHQGAFREKLEKWRSGLIRAMGCMEALIDFGDDEDIGEEHTMQQVEHELKSVLTEMHMHLKGAIKGERLRSGWRVVICGAPNAGKSSLINEIVQRNAAIVSPIAGTTRDVIEVAVDIGGFPVTIADTAGLRESSSDDIEMQGISLAQERIEESDAKLLVVDTAELLQLMSADEDDAELSGFHLDLVDENTILVLNKRDIIASQGGGPCGGCQCVTLEKTERECSLQRHEVLGKAIRKCRSAYLVSCTRHDGMERIINELENVAREFFRGRGERDSEMAEGAVITRERHRVHIGRCVDALHQAVHARDELGIELRAEYVRVALSEIGAVTGFTGVEDVLDMIFAEFCIGK